ncbi:MAG: efflux transporter outer membrane subunit [Xanthomonadales bacterium]|nr:efflux transporter outer membrane subunit [Xanthomonadales bacterium]
MMAGTLRSTVMVAAAFAVAGCVSLAPPHKLPAAPVAAEWPVVVGTPGDVPADQVGELRWDQFHADARLRDLITRALTNNRSLRATALAVESARAQLGLARADQWPTLVASVSQAAQGSAGQVTRASAAELGISAFEIDLFGRLRNERESALEGVFGAEETLRSARISLVAEVATAYVTLLADQQRLRLSDETFASQQKSLDLTLRTFAVGTSSGLDVAQSRTSVETARADMATYRTQMSRDLNALELLVGEPLDAAAFDTNGGQAGDALLAVSQAIGAPAKLSSQLLQRRPDVLAAERDLRAADINIGAARASRFPSISLTTSAGRTSSELSDLFKGAAHTWSFLPSISLPLFDGGAGKARVRSAEVARDAALVAYEQSIQTAFQEVADALAQRRDIDELLAARQALVAATERSYTLTQARYRAGVDSSLALLDAQRSLVAARQNLISARLVEATNLITLYRVLGGGWQ